VTKKRFDTIMRLRARIAELEEQLNAAREWIEHKRKWMRDYGLEIRSRVYEPHEYVKSTHCRACFYARRHQTHTSRRRFMREHGQKENQK
jgi:hypothetical protein